MGLFGKKPEKKVEAVPAANTYVLMDSNSRLCARGYRREAPDGKTLFIALSEGDPAQLSRIGILQAIPQDKSIPPQMVRFIGSRERLIALEPMRDLGAAMRKNFRVPVAFDSFLYPMNRPRAQLRSVDLSCGGVAFRCRINLAVGEIFEIVIPLTAEGPLLLHAEVLRVHLDPNGNIYACKFVDTIDDEETMLREAVFAIQISATKVRR